MESKFVDLQSVVDEILKGPLGKPMSVEEMFRMYDQTGYLYGNFTDSHIDTRNNPGNPIITEDIECEIIEPKQLPAP